MRVFTFFAIFTALFAMCITAFAAVPPIINYQGKLVGADGKPLVDGPYALTFAIYGAPTGGTALWSETNPAVTVKGGVYSVLLGSVVNLPANIFDAPDRFFGVTVGNGAELTPRQAIASVPFAIRAAVADTVAAGSDIANTMATGWIPANETWTYYSAQGVHMAAGGDQKYSLGDKIRYKQGGAWKYGYVDAVNETFHILGINAGSDYSVNDAPITDAYYSKASSPVGFPAGFVVYPAITWSDGTTNPNSFVNNIMFFSINGRTVTYNYWFYSTDLGAGNRQTIGVTLPITPVLSSMQRYSVSASQIKNGVMSPTGGRIVSYGLDIGRIDMSGALAFELYAGGSYQF